MKKINTKTTNPDFVVDLTKCVDSRDIRTAFIMAKAKSGIPVSEKDLDILIQEAIDSFIALMFEKGNTVMINNEGKLVPMNLVAKKKEEVKEEIKPDSEDTKCESKDETPEPVIEKKPGFFKRIWNKITRK